MNIPDAFVWTKYGTESGESPLEVLARKEQERLKAGGVFLWGIGTSVAPALRALLDTVRGPEVLFSPMRSKPKQVDVVPESVLVWRGALDMNSVPWNMPVGSVVTSRMGLRHWALVCHSESPLDNSGACADIPVEQLRNYATGTALGHSQVTSVVRFKKTLPREGSMVYSVGLRAKLVAPYLVRLTDAMSFA